jgi:hypothetical protein
MTDLRALLAQIDQALAECDATRLPPLVKLTPEQFDELCQQGSNADDVLDAATEYARWPTPPARNWWRRILGRPR